MVQQLSKYAARLEAFFLKGHVWIFVGLVLFFCLVLATEAESTSLLNYLSMVAGVCLLYLPTLTFIAYRVRLKKWLHKWVYRLLWVFIFAGYPLLLFPLGITINDLVPGGNIVPPDSQENTEGLQMVGGMFFLLATFLFGLLDNKWLPDLRKFFGPSSVPKIIGLFGLLAAMLAVAGHHNFQQATAGANDLQFIFIFLSSVWQTVAIYLPYLLLFYFHYQLLYRRMLAERGVIYYLLSVGATILLFAPLHAAYALLFPITMEWEMHTAGLRGQIGIVAPENHAVAFVFMTMSLPVILFLEWVRKTRIITLLEKEKTATELDLLKQQVNPHFFFNTLNNLYALSLKEAPETPETILQLSELMRYVIYKAKAERVELQQEVKYLRDYLDLQRIRLYQTADIDLVVALDNPKLPVPPLLFIILLENAFKHGIEPAVGDCFLHLELTEHRGHIRFVCHNSREPAAVKKTKPGGVGLTNLQRRLELLYPNRFELLTEESPDSYRVVLSLWEPESINAPAFAPDIPAELDLIELVPERLPRH